MTEDYYARTAYRSNDPNARIAAQKRSRQKAALDVFEKISDGNIYTVQVTESDKDSDGVDGYAPPGALRDCTVHVSVTRAEIHSVTVPELPNYAEMRARDLSVSALEEIKRRISRSVRRLFHVDR